MGQYIESVFDLPSSVVETLKMCTLVSQFNATAHEKLTAGKN